MEIKCDNRRHNNLSSNQRKNHTNVHELTPLREVVGGDMVKIAVLVKQVPDTNSKIQVNSERVDLSSVKMVMSPYDEFALENAMQHKEALGGTVVAITLGDSGADKILRNAKAIGADEMIRIDCSQYLDSNSLQNALSQVITSEGFEIVYCGKSAADTGAGSTGPGVAERLGWCSVSNVTDIIFGDSITVNTPADGGNAVIDVSLPAVISCDKGSSKVRKPNVKGIMMAKKAPIEVKDVQLSESTVKVVSHSMPPAKPAGKKYEGGQSAQTVVQLLRDEANVI